MQRIKINRRESSRVLLASLIVVSGALLISVAGCGEGEESEILVPGASAATLGMAPPTLSELQGAVDMNPGQTSVVEPALEAWRARYQEEGSLQQGPGKQHREPLFMEFLEDCSGSLDDQQFSDLIAFLAERVARHREGLENGRHARRGPRHSGGDDLGLSGEQRTAVRDAMKTAHETLKAARQQHMDGMLSAEGVRDVAESAVSGLKAALASVLDDDQFAAVSERHALRAATMAERRLGNLDQRVERRISFLTKVLGLEPGQVTALEALAEEQRPSKEALFTAIKNGELAFPEALYETIQIREAGKEAMDSILNEGQENRLVQLKGLLPGRRGMPIYF